MLTKITTRLLQSFSMKNKTQNFFDMNPIYPDFGEKNFDIYNAERKTIRVIDQYQKYQQRDIRFRELVKKRIYLQKYMKYKRYSGGKTFKLDKKTNLLLGINSDFDDYINLYKNNLFLDNTAESQYKQTLLKLIYKFKCKSQIQLIKLFRISIANSRKKNLHQKIRDNVIKQAVLKAAEIMKNYTVVKNQKHNNDQLEQNRFQRTLRAIDRKIQKVQQQLRYDIRGVPKVLSDYDPKYGWKQVRQQMKNMNYQLNANVGPQKTIQFSSLPEPGQDLQDWSIRTRINRLYFLRRLQFLKNQKKQFVDFDFQQDIPLNITDRDKIMNQIAHKYKQDDLVQIPDLEQIYRQIDAVIDKVYVKVSGGNSKSLPDYRKQQIYDRSPAHQQFLWENINAEQILCDTMYNTDSNKNVVLTEQVIRDVSPSSHTQLTLLKMPINLYRHSQLDNLGIFNEYRVKLGDNLLRAQEMDFEPQFRQFSLETARKKYRRIQQQTAERKTSSKAAARRKTALAEVSIFSGTGIIKINGKPIQDYFGDTYYRVETLKPLVITDSSGLYDINFRVRGSGSQGQAECMGYALAKALIKLNPSHKRILSKFGFVGHDYRKKEPKKTNLYSARVRPPFVRR